MAARIMDALGPRRIEPEILVIDDNSPDGTAGIAQGLAGQYPIRVIRRIDKKGLGSAILEGIKQAKAEVICVMDADLSHPPEALPEMYKTIENGAAQLVIGSRKAAGGGTSEWIWYRKVIHAVARGLGARLTPVKDITSGFFMFDRSIIENVKLEPRSWKIGLEIMVKGSYDKVLEHPIVFVERAAGQSKMGIKEVLAYLSHLCSLA
ncbi:polyprenol monophosphomannose synthase, partial [Candidatus Margulisiibacteriota bacterium]